MEERYKTADTVPGTRSFRQFIPISDSIIGAKYVSDDQYYAIQFDFNIVHLLWPGDTLFSPSQFALCLYDRQYWVGTVEVSTENLDVKVKFMHPKLSTPLKWLSLDDLCWVPNVNVCRVVSPPELSSQTARMYYFNTSESEKVEKTIALHKNPLKIK